MPHTKKTLDALLPLLTPEEREVHVHAAVLETAEPAQLAELASDPKIRCFLLARLSDTVALIDPGAAKTCEEALLRAGHTPKIVAEDE